MVLEECLRGLVSADLRPCGTCIRPVRVRPGSGTLFSALGLLAQRWGALAPTLKGTALSASFGGPSAPDANVLHACSPYALAALSMPSYVQPRSALRRDSTHSIAAQPVRPTSVVHEHSLVHQCTRWSAKRSCHFSCNELRVTTAAY